tara:strand:- start:2356 stop:2466 length:111 start_codon:yes stop_codon:yes gene_type:complete
MNIVAPTEEGTGFIEQLMANAQQKLSDGQQVLATVR